MNILDLSDRPGFPVLIDGHNANNDPTRYFIGGTVLQRPVRIVGHVILLRKTDVLVDDIDRRRCLRHLWRTL